MQLLDLLNKPEFLECNETESIIDYLLKQGVISKNQYQEILNIKQIKLKNKLLIETLHLNSENDENENINIYGFFVNALRYAGCHFMANNIDIDEKLYGNNENDNIRRKGQVSIVIQVSAIQIKAKQLLTRQNSNSDNNNSLKNNQVNSIWLDKKSILPNPGNNYEGLSMKTKRNAKKSFFSSLVCCICLKNQRSDDMYNVDLEYNKKFQDLDKHKQVKIDILTEKSLQFYTYLNNNNNSIEREELIKYFEQIHQILVFETKFDEASMIITVICTKTNTLTALQSLLVSGQLEHDFNEILRTKSILDTLDVKDIKLSINILQEELNCAMKELDLSKKNRS